MSNQSKAQAVKAAMSVANDVADGRLKPEDLERQALDECRAAFGMVVGPEDALWPLHVDIAKQVLALDGIGYTELAEWTAIHRDRPHSAANAQPEATMPDTTTVADSALISSDDADAPLTLGEYEALPDANSVTDKASTTEPESPDTRVIRQIEAIAEQERQQ